MTTWKKCTMRSTATEISPMTPTGESQIVCTGTACLLHLLPLLSYMREHKSWPCRSNSNVRWNYTSIRMTNMWWRTVCLSFNAIRNWCDRRANLISWISMKLKSMKHASWIKSIWNTTVWWSSMAMTSTRSQELPRSQGTFSTELRTGMRMLSSSLRTWRRSSKINILMRRLTVQREQGLGQIKVG